MTNSEARKRLEEQEEVVQISLEGALELALQMLQSAREVIVQVNDHLKKIPYEESQN